MSGKKLDKRQRKDVLRKRKEKKEREDAVYGQMREG